MTKNKPIIDKVNVKECKYYYNGKCERYEEFVEADYANYSLKCICEKGNDLCAYDICDYKQLSCKIQECEKKSWEIGNLGYKIKNQRREINERLKQLKAKEKQLDKYSQALTEIKKIVALYDNKAIENGHKYIIDIIKEVENEYRF